MLSTHSSPDKKLNPRGIAIRICDSAVVMKAALYWHKNSQQTSWTHPDEAEDSQTNACIFSL